LKPSGNSITVREEFQVSVVDRTIQLVPLTEEEVAAAATGVAVLRIVTCLLADFGGPLTEDFLQSAKLLE
jgi:hypothetical protein